MPRSSKPQVLIAGVGMLPVGDHWQQSLRGLAVQAIRLAQADAPAMPRPQAIFVGNMLASSASTRLTWPPWLPSTPIWLGLKV